MFLNRSPERVPTVLVDGESVVLIPRLLHVLLHNSVTVTIAPVPLLLFVHVDVRVPGVYLPVYLPLNRHVKPGDEDHESEMPLSWLASFFVATVTMCAFYLGWAGQAFRDLVDVGVFDSVELKFGDSRIPLFKIMVFSFKFWRENKVVFEAVGDVHVDVSVVRVSRVECGHSTDGAFAGDFTVSVPTEHLVHLIHLNIVIFRQHSVPG